MIETIKRKTIFKCDKCKKFSENRNFIECRFGHKYHLFYDSFLTWLFVDPFVVEFQLCKNCYKKFKRWFK